MEIKKLWLFQVIENFYKDGQDIVQQLDAASKQVTDKLAREDIMTLQDLNSFYQQLSNALIYKAEQILTKGLFYHFFCLFKFRS